MSLVISLATKDGLVICADKRTYDPIRGDLDTTVKIRELAPSTALSSVGNPTFCDILTDVYTKRQSLRLAFSADDIISKFCQQNGFVNTAEFWSRLGHELANAFQFFLHSRLYAHWPNTGNPPDNALFVLAFFFINADAKPNISYLRFRYIKQKPPVIEIFKHEESAEIFGRVRPVILGNIAVYEELMSGGDKRFDDVRSNQLIHRFMKVNPPVETVTVEEAVDFAKLFIEITSERTHLIENSTFHVGPTTDCVLLNNQNEFEWLD